MKRLRSDVQANGSLVTMRIRAIDRFETASKGPLGDQVDLTGHICLFLRQRVLPGPRRNQHGPSSFQSCRLENTQRLEDGAADWNRGIRITRGAQKGR